MQRDATMILFRARPNQGKEVPTKMRMGYGHLIEVKMRDVVR